MQDSDPPPEPLSGPVPDPIGPHHHSVFLVVIGAEPLDPGVVAQLPAGAEVIAADSGTDHALAAGLIPRAVVGDLDSISPAGLEWARSHASIVQHPSDKDRTDTELALAHAASFHPERIILLSGGGDRLDHTLAAFGAMGGSDLIAVPHLECWWGTQHAIVLHGPSRVRLSASIGAPISLLTLHGECTGVSISGTRWELTAATLGPLSGFGVSNRVTAPTVQISVSSGVVTVMFPPSDSPRPEEVS